MTPAQRNAIVDQAAQARIAQANEILRQAEEIQRQQIAAVSPIVVQRAMENPFETNMQLGSNGIAYYSSLKPSAASNFKKISDELGFSAQLDDLRKQYERITDEESTVGFQGLSTRTGDDRELTDDDRELLDSLNKEVRRVLERQLPSSDSDFGYFRDQFGVPTRLGIGKSDFANPIYNQAIDGILETYTKTPEALESGFVSKDYWNLRSENPQEYYQKLAESAAEKLASNALSGAVPDVYNNPNANWSIQSNQKGIDQVLGSLNQLMPTISQYVLPDQLNSLYEQKLGERQQFLQAEVKDYVEGIRTPNKNTFGFVEKAFEDYIVPVIPQLAGAVGYAMGGPLGAGLASGLTSGVQNRSLEQGLETGVKTGIAAKVGESLLGGAPTEAPISDISIPYGGGAEVFPVEPWADVTITPIAGGASGGALGGVSGSSIGLLDGVKFPNQGLNVPSISSPELSLLPSDVSIPSLGLQAPTTPSLIELGGGTGLLVGTGAGTIAQGGLVPIGAVPVLGDTWSFINQPDVIGQPVIGGGKAPISDRSIPFDRDVYEATAGLEGTLKGLGNLAEAGLETLAGGLSPTDLLGLGGGGQPQGTPVMQDMGGGVSQPRGVDYSSLLGLLQQRARMSGLLGTQFQPQNINLASLLG